MKEINYAVILTAFGLDREKKFLFAAHPICDTLHPLLKGEEEKKKDREYMNKGIHF